jgi:tRNA(Ile2)-agmatinylcytidine synthase
VTVLGIDDTDSRERGMCTTYAAARLARELEARGNAVERTLLVRLNPAVEHKTRGNAALAVHTDAPPELAAELAGEALDTAEDADPRTNPGAVVAPDDPGDVPDSVAGFAADAMAEIHAIADAEGLAASAGYRSLARGNGRGRIGALAAVGAWRAFDEWTYEHISYREQKRWGTERDVDFESLFAAAEAGYPDVWDTVDEIEGEAVCVPHTPCPVLHGIRGDDPEACRAVAERIDSEPVALAHTFVTNQGTDAHLREGTFDELAEDRAYRAEGAVTADPETRRGGHVFFSVEGVPCAAFEPTKRFRERVRNLRVGDELTVCGEFSDGALKLEKFAVRGLVATEPAVPECPDCGNSMSSAGKNQGYRCRDCGTDAPAKVEREIERELEEGWYEVPPCARRHVAKPLIRGGFDAPTHPER